MISLRIIALSVFGLLPGVATLGQTLPSCSSIASDTDGDGYGWESDASCVVTSTTLTSPGFTNLETGEPVNLVRAQWSRSDFEGRRILCSEIGFDGVSYSSVLDRRQVYTFQPSGSVDAFFSDTGERFAARSWSLNNGIYSGPTDFAVTPWVEIVDYADGTQNATRVWLTNQSFTSCFELTSSGGVQLVDGVFVGDAGYFAPSGSLQAGIDHCDYTNAAQFNGWGWDAIAGESCAPMTASVPGNCDYTNAARYDGWGWNAITGQSCEPVNSTSQCLDSDGDGWGWDGTESCRLE